jgi:hypothetical protein
MAVQPYIHTSNRDLIWLRSAKNLAAVNRHTITRLSRLGGKVICQYLQFRQRIIMQIAEQTMGNSAAQFEKNGKRSTVITQNPGKWLCNNTNALRVCGRFVDTPPDIC